MKTLINKCLLESVFLTVIFFLCLNITFAQRHPAITVQPTQQIDFGTFYVTSAGSISVSWKGDVTTTGGVFVVSSKTAVPAIFEVKVCKGKNRVAITYAPTTTIINSNGVGSLTLNVGDTEKGPSSSTFKVVVNSNCTSVAAIHVGGTLTIPSAPATGTYTGTFSLTFTQDH